jgi:CheY-like chemotaxis protein
MVDRTILIVEDEATVRHLFKEQFEKEGYTVATAASAEEALAILKKQYIMVLFLDLKLPGMDGVQLCREIKKNQPISIVYAVTGYASLFQLTDCIESGFNDYFIKPVKTKALLKAARDAFEKLERWSTK